MHVMQQHIQEKRAPYVEMLSDSDIQKYGRTLECLVKKTNPLYLMYTLTDGVVVDEFSYVPSAKRVYVNRIVGPVLEINPREFANPIEYVSHIAFYPEDKIMVVAADALTQNQVRMISKIGSLQHGLTCQDATSVSTGG